jgi:Zn-dependent protease
MMDSSIFVAGVIILTVLISITLHEAMHAFASNWLGDDTARLEGRLTLNPLKHIDPFLTVLMPLLLYFAGAPILGAAKPVPFNPSRLRYDEMGAAIVAIAGPLTNLFLAVIGALFFRIFWGDASQLALSVMYLFIQVNVGFFVFNMIPFPPLDGSRVLYALAPDGVRRVMAQIEAYGLVGFIIFFFLLFNFIAPVLGNIISGIMSFLLAGIV